MEQAEFEAVKKDDVKIVHESLGRLNPRWRTYMQPLFIHIAYIAFELTYIGKTKREHAKKKYKKGNEKENRWMTALKTT